jgi:hypothetical protein
MADNGPCCGHDHVGGDEQWLTVGEIADVVFDAVESGIDAVLALPADATKEERRTAMRGEFDRRRGEQAAEAARPKTRAELHDEKARRRWGG